MIYIAFIKLVEVLLRLVIGIVLWGKVRVQLGLSVHLVGRMTDT
jgi:hypothetical protein